MARYNVPQFSDFPYHITGRCQSRMAFPGSLDRVWEVFQEELFLCNKNFGLLIHAFVLMPNHYHLLASLTDFPLGVPLHGLMSHTSHRLNKETGNMNHMWGQRAFRCLIDQNQYFFNVYRYVYQNPVKAGLVEKCEDWKYSTLNGLVGLNRIFIPVEQDTLLFTPEFDPHTLQWLNTPMQKSASQVIQKGLKKKIFKINQNDNKLLMTEPKHPLFGI